jgi:hypothetical protein
MTDATVFFSDIDSAGNLFVSGNVELVRVACSAWGVECYSV